MYTNMSVCHKQKIIYVFWNSCYNPFSINDDEVVVDILCLLFHQLFHFLPGEHFTWSWFFNRRFGILNLFSPIDFPLTFIIFYGSNISKNPQCFRQRHFVEKKHFIFDNQEQLYPLSSSSPVASVMERATNNQMTVSTLKSVEPLLCLLLKAYLWW